MASRLLALARPLRRAGAARRAGFARSYAANVATVADERVPQVDHPGAAQQFVHPRILAAPETKVGLSPRARAVGGALASLAARGVVSRARHPHPPPRRDRGDAAAPRRGGLRLPSLALRDPARPALA